MKKILAILATLLVPTAALSQTGAIADFCKQGATAAQTVGLQSTNQLQGIIPSCTITVYLTGTTSIATIYADGVSTPLGNPFTANAVTGQWLFYSAVNQGYDVVLSGGIPPNTYASPLTLTGLFPSQQFSILSANISNQANGVLPLACTANSLCVQSPIDAGISNIGEVTSTENIVLPATSNLATGLRAPTANAAVTAFSVLAFGGAADATSKGSGLTASLTSGSDIITITGAGFTSTNIVTPGGLPKWVCLNNNNVTWPSVPFSGGAPYCATINLPFIDGNHAHLSRTAANTVSAVARWGTDNAPAFNACAAALYVANGPLGGTCKVPSSGTSSYLLATQPYYVLMKGVDGGVDTGDYGQPAGGSGAVIASAISGGAITGWTVSAGGSLYTPNSDLQVVITGGCPTGLPCGQAWATAHTNGSGVVVSVTNVFAGFGFTSPPTGTVTSLGGDGVTATVTLSTGTTSTPTLGVAGAGYSGSTLDYFLINATAGSSGCTVLRTLNDGVQILGQGTATLSGGIATGAFTVTTNATGCTNPPIVVFGANGSCNIGTLGSPTWTQCVNLPPLSPVKMPLQVFVSTGVSFIGEQGGSLTSILLAGDWDKSTTDSNASAMFGNQEISHSDLGGFNITDSMIGITSASYVNYAYIHDIDFLSGIGMFTEASDTQSRYNNLSFDGIVSWVNGGVWAHRIDFPTGQGGEFDADSINDLVVRVTPYGGPGSMSQKLDDWFANTFWHPEYSGASPDWPTGEVCKFPQSVNQRQTGQNMLIGFNGYTANTGCYRGISSVGFAVYTRDDRGSGNASITQFRVKQLSRPGFIGSIGGMTISGLGCEGCTPLTGSNDPYRAASKQEGFIVYTGSGSSSGQFPTILGTGFGGNSNITQTFWDIANQGTPANTIWNNNILSQTVDNPQDFANPSYVNQIDFPFGIALTYANSVGHSGPLDLYGTSATANPIFRMQNAFNGASFLTGSGAAPAVDTFDLTNGAVNIPGTTHPFTMAGAAGSSTNVLISGGAGVTPHWGAVPGITRTTFSFTPAAVTASTCAEQFFGSGIGGAGVYVNINPPSSMVASHTWIGSVRQSAGTVAVMFCGDATGGTPPSGNWVVYTY